MYSLTQLYQLQTSFAAIEQLDAYEGGHFRYLGEALPTGPDAAIEVVDGVISVWLNGEPCPNDHGMRDIVENYDTSILEGASKFAKQKGARVIFVGRYVHTEPEWNDPMFVGYLLHAVSAEGVVVTNRYELDVFDWDDLSNASQFSFERRRPTVNTAGADLSLAMRQVAERELHLDTAIRTDMGEHYLDSVMFYPATNADRTSLPFVVVHGVGVRAFKNERLLGSGDGDLRRAYDGYSVDLEELKRAASAVRSSPDALKPEAVDAAYKRVKDRAESLGTFGFDPQLEAAVREALVDTRFVQFRGAIHFRDSITEPMNFLELYHAGIIDRAILEVSIESKKNGDPLVPGGSEISRSVKVFDERFKQPAAEFIGRACRGTGIDRSETSHNFESEWSNWGEGRLARLVA